LAQDLKSNQRLFLVPGTKPDPRCTKWRPKGFQFPFYLGCTLGAYFPVPTRNTLCPLVSFPTISNEFCFDVGHPFHSLFKCCLFRFLFNTICFFLFRMLWAIVSIFRSTPRSSHTLTYIFICICPRKKNHIFLFIIAFSCERLAAEGRPHWITKHLSWAGGRRPPLADPRLILTPSFSRPVASSDPFRWPLPTLTHCYICTRISAVSSSSSSPHNHQTNIIVGPPLAGLNF